MIAAGSSSSGAFVGCSGLERVVFDDCEVDIGNYTFYNCRKLNDVIFGSGVRRIGNSAFQYCIELISIELPASLASIGDSVFYGCTKLSEINLGIGVRTIGSRAFYGCELLESVTFPQSLTSIAGISNYGAFQGCSKLYSVEFDNCAASIGGYTFWGCTSLANVEFGDSIRSIGTYAFYNTRISDVVIPDSVTSVGEYAFANCTNLINAYIGSGTRSIGVGAFYNCARLRSIDVDEDNLSYASEDGVLFNAAITTLIKFPTGAQRASYEVPYSIRTIPEGAFHNCTLLESIALPSKLRSIANGSTTTGAFVGCINLESVDFNNSAADIGNYAFYGCSKLIDLGFGNSVNFIGISAFQDCTKLTSIILPSGVTSIEDSSFSGCTSLRYITFGNGVQTIGSRAFYRCTSLISVAFPPSLTLVAGSSNNGAFQGCNSLESVTFNNCEADIGGYVFSECTKLVDVDLGDRVQAIGAYAFSGCTSLTSLELGNSIKNIGSLAFRNTQIQTITLPPSIRLFGTSGSFSSMPALRRIVFEAGTEAISAYAFFGISTATPVDVFIPRSVIFISPDSNMSSNTRVNCFAESYAEEYAIERSISYFTLPSVLVQDKLPQGFQYLPYSFSFASSEGSWLDIVGGTLPPGLEINIQEGDRWRTVGEIWGAPMQRGTYELTVMATDGNIYPLKDDIVTLTINIEQAYVSSDWIAELLLNDDLIEVYFGDYIDYTDNTRVIIVYNPNPDDKVIVFGHGIGDFIGLWINGELMKEDVDLSGDGDYFVNRGSTIVTVYGKTLSELRPNTKHVIVGEFKMGGEADGEHCIVGQTFKIVRRNRGSNRRSGLDENLDENLDISPDEDIDSNFSIDIVDNLGDDPESNPSDDSVRNQNRQYQESNPVSSLSGNLVGSSGGFSGGNPSDTIGDNPNDDQTDNPSGNIGGNPDDASDDTSPINMPPIAMSNLIETTVYATVTLDETGTVAYARVSSNEILASAEKAIQEAAEAGAQSSMRIWIEVPENVFEFILILSDETMRILVESSVDMLILDSRLGKMSIVDTTIVTTDNTRGGQDVEITFRHLVDPHLKLNEAQLSVLGVNSAFEFTIKAGSSYVSDLGGIMSIELPYTLKPDQNSEDIFVYHLAEDGSSTSMPSIHKESEHIVAFDTTHLSVFAIGCETISNSDGVNLTYIFLICGGLLLSAVLVLVLVRVLTTHKRTTRQ